MDRKTVLVIDDEEHVRMLYAEELGALGYKTVLSDGGSDPLALVEEHKPDLIILDIKLESRSGLDMLQIIRCKHAVLPVIGIGAHLEGHRPVVHQRIQHRMRADAQRRRGAEDRHKQAVADRIAQPAQQLVHRQFFPGEELLHQADLALGGSLDKLLARPLDFLT